MSHYGFRGTANLWLRNYLTGRKQYTTINSTNSSMKDVLTGVPQGSVLGPLLFILLINDLPNASKLLLSLLFADDTTLQITSNDINYLYITANEELQKVSEWFKANKLTLNLSKTKYILFRKHTDKVDFTNFDLTIDSVNIERIGTSCKEQSFKFVGVHIDEYIDWNFHINYVRSKLVSANFALSKVKYIFPEKVKLSIYNSLFKSYVEYCLIAWGNVKPSKLKPLEILQKKCIRNIAGVKYRSHTNPIFSRLKILKVNDLVKYQIYTFMYNYINNFCPNSFTGFFTPYNNENRSRNFRLPVPFKKSLDHFPSYNVPKIWNNLGLTYKRIENYQSFKSKVRELLIKQ